MTNSALKETARKTLRQLFPDENAYRLTLESIRGNGVYICVEHHYPATPQSLCPYATSSTVGYNLKVHAIAGEQNVIRAINERYARHAR